MSSLMTCSGQGVVVQGKGNEKECVVEGIRNKSSQSHGGNSDILGNSQDYGEVTSHHQRGPY